MVPDLKRGHSSMEPTRAMRRICPPLGIGTEGPPKAAFLLANPRQDPCHVGLAWLGLALALFTITSETATMHDDWMEQHHRTLCENLYSMAPLRHTGLTQPLTRQSSNRLLRSWPAPYSSQGQRRCDSSRFLELFETKRSQPYQPPCANRMSVHSRKQRPSLQPIHHLSFRFSRSR
jgi:hypothetical protein